MTWHGRRKCKLAVHHDIHSNKSRHKYQRSLYNSNSSSSSSSSNSSNSSSKARYHHPSNLTMSLSLMILLCHLISTRDWIFFPQSYDPSG